MESHPLLTHFWICGSVLHKNLSWARFLMARILTYVNKFIKGCTVCQQNKVNTHLVCPPLNPIPSFSSLPFKQLSVDFITDLSDIQGLNSILVVVDHSLTKGVIIIPCFKTINATGVGKLFFLHVFNRFGLHDSLVSDREPRFASALVRELARLLKYDIKLSTAYHPQTDRQMEQTNQEIETYLHIFCTNNPWSWPNLLSTTEFQHNSAPHHSTRVSLFFLMLEYKSQAYLPIRKTFLLTLENCLFALNEAQKEALAAHKSTQQIMRKWTTKTFTLWKVGDKVWLEATNLHLQYPSRKLTPRHQGPFEISQVLSPIIYHLWLPPTWKIHDVLHASLLSPFKQTNTHGQSFVSPPLDLIRSEEEYKMEAIIFHEGPPGWQKYLTAWKGYPSSENTWELETNLKHAKQILKEYKRTTMSLSWKKPSTLKSNSLPWPVHWTNISKILGLSPYQLQFLWWHSLLLEHMSTHSCFCSYFDCPIHG